MRSAVTWLCVQMYQGYAYSCNLVMCTDIPGFYIDKYCKHTSISTILIEFLIAPETNFRITPNFSGPAFSVLVVC